MDHRTSLGVSAIVRVRRDVVRVISAGTVGMIIGQASNGRFRYAVMFPGYAFPFSLPASDLELVQGLVADARWWAAT